MERATDGNAVRWDFVHRGDGTWIWQRTTSDGCVRRSAAPHKSLGVLMQEAVAAGFAPGRHRWIIDDSLAVTHFAPGEEPQILRK